MGAGRTQISMQKKSKQLLQLCPAKAVEPNSALRRVAAHSVFLPECSCRGRPGGRVRVCAHGTVGRTETWQVPPQPGDQVNVYSDKGSLQAPLP